MYEGIKDGINRQCALIRKENYPAVIKICKDRLIENISTHTDHFVKPVQIIKDEEKAKEQSKQLINCLTLLYLKDDEIDVKYFADVSMTEFGAMAKTIYKGCKVCSKEGNKRCGGCGWAYYCSTECQKAHWKEHKKDCLCNRK